MRLLAFASAFFLLHPKTASAQLPEKLYVYNVPVHLTKLADELVKVSLYCWGSPPYYQPQAVPIAETHDLKVVNHAVDTTVVIRMTLKNNNPQDVGKQGVFTCKLTGFRAQDTQGQEFSPTSPIIAFRLTPALPPITQAFVW